MNNYKFLRGYPTNPYRTRCQLQVGSTFIFRGMYCTVSRMSYRHFEYVIQETQRTGHMNYDYYLTTPSAAGRQLNRRY